METNLGTIVVDGVRSRAVYVFAADPPGRSTCTGSCTNLWPPLLTEGFPQAGEGINAELLGYITRREGGFQVTYDNQPLYGYAGDLNPGSTLGHGVGGNWSAIRPDGRPR
jgi:predicted lipoprotein with Yx(FWY)xxD motif